MRDGYFFKHLKVACPRLHMQNVIQRCGAYKYFTVVSDRDEVWIAGIKMHTTDRKNILGTKRAFVIASVE
jgi:hypothetical protein